MQHSPHDAGEQYKEAADLEPPRYTKGVRQKMSAVISRWSRVFMPVLAAVILVTGVSIGKASAQGVFVRRVQVLYEGNPTDQASVKLGSWGSGVCEESTSNTFTGSRSLKITPKDLYTGGRIDFTSPFDLAPSLKASDGYLQFACQFWGTQETDALTLALGTTATVDNGNVPGKQVKRIRIVLFFENGPAVECQSPISAYEVGDDGWMIVSFPLSALKGKTDLPQYRLTRIVVTGDGTEPFYIGEIRTISDTSPLVADAGEDMEISKNYPIAYQGFCQSGASAVKYSWDFDKKNGVQEEAVGDLIYHRFSQAGAYEVTLTCTDIFGVKAPATKSIQVKVNE